MRKRSILRLAAVAAFVTTTAVGCTGGDDNTDAGAVAEDAGPGPVTVTDAGPGPVAVTDAGPGPVTDAGPGPSTDAGPGPSTDAGPGPSTDAGPGSTDAGPQEISCAAGQFAAAGTTDLADCAPCTADTFSAEGATECTPCTAGQWAAEGATACQNAPVMVTDHYDTATQLLLANEINESGEPFAEALGYNLDLLDPAIPDMPSKTPYVLGIENYEYSRYQLGTVISRSGIGLHMMWGPKVMAAAAADLAANPNFDGSATGGTSNGYSEDDELMKTIGAFSMMSGQAPPGNPWPQFADFKGGDPRLPQTIDAANFAWDDFSSLRWDRSKMDKTLNPAAMGQSLMKQYLWAQDMLSAFHDGNDVGIEADGTVTPDMAGSPMFDPNNNVFYGGDNLDGFVGMVLTAEAINKIAFTKGMLAYDGTNLGGIDLPNYDPVNGIQFFPHAIAVTEAPVLVAGMPSGLPPKMDTLTVTDASSSLFDQASLLWGTTSFTSMMNPTDNSDSAHLAYHSAFDGMPFPPSASESGGTPGPYDLMKGTSKAIFMNLQAMHHDATNAVYVDTANLGGAGVERGTEVSTVASAYMIVALEVFVGQFAGTPLEGAATQAITDQANFLKDHLSDGAGGFYESATIGSVGTTQSLASQAAALRGLYTAYRVTGDMAFKTAADEGYGVLIADYYMPSLGIFKTDSASMSAVFTPRTFALLAGGLREAALEGEQVEAAGIYVDAFRRIAGTMQLSEGGNTGESGNDVDGDGIPFIPEQPDGLPPVFATQATFDLTAP